MSTIIIRRCPASPAIDSHAHAVSLALLGGFGLRALIEDGNKDEFSVLVDGSIVLSRTESVLPSVEEVESAVQSASPVNKSVAHTGIVHQTVPPVFRDPGS